MAKVNKTGRNSTEQYAKLGYAMLRSPAFRSLSGAAVKIYFEVRTRYHGGNNGRLTLSLDEAARCLGMSKSTARRALQELTEKGFLTLIKRGNWYGRLASEYAVTDKPLKGEPPSHAWKKWAPPKTESRYSNDTIDQPDGAISVPKNSRRCHLGTRQGNSGHGDGAI